MSPGDKSNTTVGLFRHRKPCLSNWREMRWHVFKRVILCFRFHDITLECTFGTVLLISGDNDSFLDPKITQNKLFLSAGKQSGRITGAIYKSNITQNSSEGMHSCCRSHVLRGEYQICRWDAISYFLVERLPHEEKNCDANSTNNSSVCLWVRRQITAHRSTSGLGWEPSSLLISCMCVRG